MVRVACGLAVLALALGCGGASPEAVEQELGKLKGTWVLVPDDGGPATMALRIDGTAVAWETRQESRPSKLDYTFTVDPGSDPARIRLTGGVRGATMLASYGVEGDQLKLCLSWDNQSHPRRLDDDHGRLYVFRRQDVPWPAPDDPYWKEWARKRKQRESVLRELGQGYIATSKKGGPP